MTMKSFSKPGVSWANWLFILLILLTVCGSCFYARKNEVNLDVLTF